MVRLADSCNNVTCADLSSFYLKFRPMKSLLICSFIACLFLTACTKEKSAETTTPESAQAISVIDLTPAEFASQSKDGILVDVRTPAEISEGAIEGAIVMDFSQANFQAQLTQLPKDRAIYLYCAVGGRSSKAGDLLIQHGYPRVYNLAGGIIAWKEVRLPVTIPQ